MPTPMLTPSSTKTKAKNTQPFDAQEADVAYQLRFAFARDDAARRGLYRLVQELGKALVPLEVKEHAFARVSSVLERILDQYVFPTTPIVSTAAAQTSTTSASMLSKAIARTDNVKPLPGSEDGDTFFIPSSTITNSLAFSHLTQRLEGVFATTYILLGAQAKIKSSSKDKAQIQTQQADVEAGTQLVLERYLRLLKSGSIYAAVRVVVQDEGEMKSNNGGQTSKLSSTLSAAEIEKAHMLKALILRGTILRLPSL